MAQNKKEESELKVTDRRLFTADGELRSNAREENAKQTDAGSATASTVTPAASNSGFTAPPTSSAAPAAVSASSSADAFRGGASTAVEDRPVEDVLAGASAGQEDVPDPPTASEQKAQHDAYQKSSRDLDQRVELSGHSAKELEVTFERFMASLYMTAMMQLGLMREQGGQPGVDLLGARQTIDTLGMVAEKTKGNLTAKEQGFLQNCLYELRMAYVEVTNALARAPQAPGSNTGTHG